MIQTLSQFTDCIASFNILIQETRGDLAKTKIRVDFINGSVIFLREIIIQNVLPNYAYRWQNADDSLIILWDNAPCSPSISTPPHHKHVLNETKVQLLIEQNLFLVLSVIRNELLRKK